jgi:histone deacetylase 1/2/histone deacetylase 8
MHTPHPFSLAYPLAAYPSSATYARAWAAVERVAAAWAPDYVVLQLGVDGLPRDPVGMYGAWGVQGAGSVPWVVEQVAKWDRPTVILGGGGYVNDNAARAWALATAAVVGKPLAAHDDIPDHEFWQEYAPAYTLEVPESKWRESA